MAQQAAQERVAMYTALIRGSQMIVKEENEKIAEWSFKLQQAAEEVVANDRAG